MMRDIFLKLKKNKHYEIIDKSKNDYRIFEVIDIKYDTGINCNLNNYRYSKEYPFSNRYYIRYLFTKSIQPELTWTSFNNGRWKARELNCIEEVEDKIMVQKI